MTGKSEKDRFPNEVHLALCGHRAGGQRPGYASSNPWALVFLQWINCGKSTNQAGGFGEMVPLASEPLWRWLPLLSWPD